MEQLEYNLGKEKEALASGLEREQAMHEELVAFKGENQELNERVAELSTASILLWTPRQHTNSPP